MKLQLDGIVESLDTVERVEEVEVAPPMIPKIESETLVLDAVVSNKFVAEPCRINIVRQPPQWYEKEFFILDDDDLMSYKEAMMGPSCT
jgi:hypothetical protein